MRHRNQGPKLNRSPAHRKSMGANLATALLTHGRIQTTAPKARWPAGIAEKAITLAKENTLHSRRQAIALLRNKDVTYRLFDVIGPAFSDVQGGYTRTLKLGPRQGDAAPMVLLELSKDVGAPAARAGGRAAGSSGSTWSTTGRGSPAGPPSRGSAPSRATLPAPSRTLLRGAGGADGRRPHRRRRARLGPGRRAWPPASDLAAGAHPARPGRRCCRTTSRVARRGRRARPASTPAATPARAATSTGCCPGPPSALRRGRVLHHPAPLDAARWPPPPRCWWGSHDFRAFTPTRTEHVFFDRTVAVCDWERRGDELVLVVEADAFLRHMVRVAGRHDAAGRPGAWPSRRGWTALLEGAPRGAAGPTAPAHPLTLVGVRYGPSPGSAATGAALTHILVTNDDGVHSAGLLALKQALEPVGRVSVIAPDSNRSAIGRGITIHNPLHVEEVRWPTAPPALATDGTPVDCVRFATLGLLERAARRDRQRHQPGPEPRRRRHLLGHRRRRAGGGRCSGPGDRGLGAGDRPDGRPVGRHAPTTSAPSPASPPRLVPRVLPRRLPAPGRR